MFVWSSEVEDNILIGRGMFRKLAIVTCLLFGVTCAPVHAAEDYVLGVADKVQIRVAEWQTTEGTIRDWSSLTGVYTVGPSGTLALPFLGEMPAAGRPTSAIGEDIGSGLEVLFGLKNRPSASVEIATFRPIFVSGDVEKPGEYPFTPKLTLSKAVTLAGGLRRADGRFARDVISAKGELSVDLARKGRLLARRARVQSEIAGKDVIDTPKELKDFPDVQELMTSETTLMDSRKKRLGLQLQALADLKKLLGSEIVSLAKKTETQTRQLELAKEDLDKVDDLAERGLVLRDRKLAAEQRTADIEATLLDIDTASLRAKQDISRADQSEITLRNDWSAQLAQELQETQDETERVNLQMSTSKGLITEALDQSVDASRYDTNIQEANLRRSIVREVNGAFKEIQAEENTILEPGDQVKVTAEIVAQ
ncbi:polysaccharide biosynthesis/export family protein [Rhizobium sp. 18055]|uniref:polysaccharide biosynthesis/export family protein n=1 Tax=Rhizobium sp. 18055 TaxID=2681403 RepID=UPI001FCE88E3|nr:polysaccharide biosynthesis/export family protein [Rhizobium sp. 18055]